MGNNCGRYTVWHNTIHFIGRLKKSFIFHCCSLETAPLSNFLWPTSRAFQLAGMGVHPHRDRTWPHCCYLLVLGVNTSTVPHSVSFGAKDLKITSARCFGHIKMQPCKMAKFASVCSYYKVYIERFLALSPNSSNGIHDLIFLVFLWTVERAI